MITIIIGTNRTGSVSAQVAAFVAKVYDELGINNRVLDIADLPPETFSPNAYVEKPPRVVEFTEQILASSGLFVITPEYNGSMSGALKLFIDMLPFPESFEDRPVSYIGVSAGQFGGLRSRRALATSVWLSQCHKLSSPRFYPCGWIGHGAIGWIRGK